MKYTDITVFVTVVVALICSLLSLMAGLWVYGPSDDVLSEFVVKYSGASFCVKTSSGDDSVTYSCSCSETKTLKISVTSEMQPSATCKE